jgi:hypothetical protein
MRGGTIQGNKAENGAGVYTENSGDAIELTYDARKAVRSPSDVSLERGITTTKKSTNIPAFTLSGGSITGNEAEFVGGGVFAKTMAAFSKGTGTLSGNSAGDGEGEDVYINQ